MQLDIELNLKSELVNTTFHCMTGFLHVTLAVFLERTQACKEVNVVIQGKTCLRLSSLEGCLVPHAGGCKQAEVNRAIRATL